MTEFITIPWLSLGIGFVVSLFLSLTLTPIISQWATNRGYLDLPGGRHLHTRAVPRLGGIGIWLSVMVASVFILGFTPSLVGLYLGLTTLFIVGLIDDISPLPSSVKLLAQLLAGSFLVIFGVTVSNITNPIGGTILLPPEIDIFITLLWIVLVVNTINLFDGLDGLATSISATTAIAIASVSLLAIVNQPSTAQLAIIVLGASLGFLFYNWHPAKIFMGDSGSYSLGFLLATLSIISGGKLATASLVLGLPLIDTIWIVFRRIKSGKLPWSADRDHLHHRLIDKGFSPPQVVGIVAGVSLLFGLIGILSGTWVKLLMLGVAIATTISLVRFSRR